MGRKCCHIVAVLNTRKLSERALGNTPLLSSNVLSRRIDLPMNSTSFATKDSPNLLEAERLSRAKPLLFLHIPKTGGSSFLTVLGNVFGERRVRRLRRADEMEQA